jgi:hypothetical protein
LAVVIVLHGVMCCGCAASEKRKAVVDIDKVLESAGRAASAVLPDEVANTFPVPVLLGGRGLLQILYYRETGSPGQRIIHNPHYCMRLDPYTAQVVRFWPCEPHEIGGDEVPVVVPPGMPERLTVEDFIKKQRRLASLSPEVIELYFDNVEQLDLPAVASVKEYYDLFFATHGKKQATFVVNAAPDFFRWLQLHVERAR